MSDSNLPPDLMTKPRELYLRSQAELVNFAMFITGLPEELDETYEIVSKIIEVIDEAPDPVIRGRVGMATRRLREFKRLVLELIVTWGTDNFLNYVSELLATAFRTRPEMLRSSETIRADEALRCASIEELVTMIAERRVERLSYLGMRDLNADLAEKFEFPLFLNDIDLQRAVRIVEIRNLISHNRGLVNAVFRRKTGDTSLAVGERIELRVKPIFSDLDFFNDSVRDIDERAGRKFCSAPL